MFPWQSNSSTRDNDAACGDQEAPETPAHLFPVRAFKHAIFGTPAAPKTDRKPIRPRPQTSYDTSRSSDFDALSRSPGKAGGILRTPGTGGQKRKSVSFGGAGENSYEAAVGAHLGERPNSKDGLAEDPNKARTGSLKPSDFARKLRGDPKASSAVKDQEDVTLDMDAPRSVSGKYWKSEFDDYSTNTERQLKKLVKKEQVAKKYAQLRDGAAFQLEEDLRRESERATQLEKKVEEFQRQLKSALGGIPVTPVDLEKDRELERLRKENERLKAQLKAQWHAQTEAKMSLQPKTRSPERPAINRATTEPAAASPRPETQQVQQPKRRADQSRQVPATRTLQPEAAKEISDIWADAGTPITTRETPRRRPKDREPLALRTENVESRSSSAAATLGTKPSVVHIAEDKEAVSRSSSTAGTLGSKRQSLDAGREAIAGAEQVSDNASKTSMTSERQAAARKRLEERKRARQRATVS